MGIRARIALIQESKESIAQSSIESFRSIDDDFRVAERSALVLIFIMLSESFIMLLLLRRSHGSSVGYKLRTHKSYSVDLQALSASFTLSTSLRGRAVRFELIVLRCFSYRS